MDNDGYLQIKVREQNEKIVELENKMKKLENKIGFSKQGYDDAVSLIKNANDLRVFKESIIVNVRKDLKILAKSFAKKIDDIQTNNQEWLDYNLKYSINILKERNNAVIHTFVGALGKTLMKKHILDFGELKKILDEHTKDFEEWKNKKIKEGNDGRKNKNTYICNK